VNVLVLNVGSSSLKFQLVRTDAARIESGGDERLARGMVERIGGEAVYAFRGGDGETVRGTAPLRDHRAAVEYVLAWMVAPDSGVPIDSLAEIGAAGHRVVHGGERFVRSVAIDDAVLRGIEDTIDLAPLHNPANLKGIQAVRAVLGPGVPQVAVFDTAFHHTLPERAFLYAIPYSLYRRHRVRRYGFHGTSHRYVSYRWRQLTGRGREGSRLVTLHLGNGCSACAILDGASVDTSMGFTPLEGLVMGTRAGDVDPAVLDYVAEKEGLTLAEVLTMLNKQSGLLGISGLTHDMRELLAEADEHDDRRAWLAIEMFAYRVRKYVGSYLAALGGADAVVFAGGVGENAPAIRRAVLDGLQWAGIHLDDAANAAAVGGREGRISPQGATPEVWVIPTDEELLIARDAYRVVHGIETRY
jgi:acetate kinase